MRFNSCTDLTDREPKPQVENACNSENIIYYPADVDSYTLLALGRQIPDELNNHEYTTVMRRLVAEGWL